MHLQKPSIQLNLSETFTENHRNPLASDKRYFSSYGASNN